MQFSYIPQMTVCNSSHAGERVISVPAMPSGTAYLLYASDNNQNFKIARLDANYYNVTGVVSQLNGDDHDVGDERTEILRLLLVRRLDSRVTWCRQAKRRKCHPVIV